jgi:hypothetical protein
MKQTVITSCLSLVAVLGLAIGISASPAQATSIGTLSAGSSFSDTISAPGPTFSQDYTFHLDGSASGLSLLATALGQTSASFGVDSLKISLFDSSSNLIATTSGAPFISFDTFEHTGTALAAGNYLFNVFGDVTAGKQAFVLVSLAANNVAATPIPASGFMLLTGLGLLGGLGLRRHRASGAAQIGRVA